jgi:PadR family transcriptional regulator AphA
MRYQMNKNRTEFAILGILTLEPMSGYDFRKAAEQCLGFFWQESYGQIYPTLKKMLEKGYLSQSRKKTEGKPDKHIYSITKKGKDAFNAWLDQETRIEPKRIELLLKLFFGGKTDHDAQIRELESIKETHKKLLAELKDIEDWHIKNYDHHALTPYWLVTIRFGIHRISAMIAWCKESVEMLKKAQKETFSSVPDPINFYFKSRKI